MHTMLNSLPKNGSKSSITSFWKPSNDFLNANIVVLESFCNKWYVFYTLLHISGVKIMYTILNSLPKSGLKSLITSKWVIDK